MVWTWGKEQGPHTAPNATEVQSMATEGRFEKKSHCSLLISTRTGTHTHTVGNAEPPERMWRGLHDLGGLHLRKMSYGFVSKTSQGLKKF